MSRLDAGILRNSFLRRLALAPVLTVIAFPGLWPSGVSGQQRYKTLREIGAERDVEVSLAGLESDGEYNDLESLTRAAYAIVVGRLTREESRFDGDSFIVTTYQVELRRVIKDAHFTTCAPPGYAEPGSLTTPLKIVRSGGVVQVSGHRVATRLKGSELLTGDKDYVLFLYWSPAFNSYRLLGGSSGAFLVRDGSYEIQPLGSASAMLKYAGMNLETFLDEVALLQKKQAEIER